MTALWGGLSPSVYAKLQESGLSVAAFSSSYMSCSDTDTLRYSVHSSLGVSFQETGIWLQGGKAPLGPGFLLKSRRTGRGEAVLVTINSTCTQVPPPALSSSGQGAGDGLYPRILHKQTKTLFFFLTQSALNNKIYRFR